MRLGLGVRFLAPSGGGELALMELAKVVETGACFYLASEVTLVETYCLLHTSPSSSPSSIYNACSYRRSMGILGHAGPRYGLFTCLERDTRRLCLALDTHKLKMRVFRSSMGQCQSMFVNCAYPLSSTSPQASDGLGVQLLLVKGELRGTGRSVVAIPGGRH